MELSFCRVLGHLALSCGTIAEAFARFARYQRLLYEGAGDVMITYNQPQLYVELSVDFLNQRINSQNPELNALFDQQANVLLTALPRQNAFDNHLRHAVIQCIHKGPPTKVRMTSL